MNSRRYVLSFILFLSLFFLICGTGSGPDTTGITVSSSGGVYTLNNGVYELKYNMKDFTWTASRGGTVFLSSAILAGPVNDYTEYKPEAELVNIDTLLGPGKAIRIVEDETRTYSLMLFKDRPFIIIGCKMINPYAGTSSADDEQYLSGRLMPDVSAENITVLAHDGLFTVDSVKSTYNWTAAVEKGTNRGMVVGWLTNREGSGIAGIKPENDSLTIYAYSEYGRRHIPPLAEADGELLAAGYFDNCLDGLEQYGDLTAEINHIKVKTPAPGGYCTWYQEDPRKTKFRGASNERDLLRFIKFCKDNHLQDYGFEVIQIDDGWQIGKRDYSAYAPGGPYPNGFKKVTDAAKEAGFRPGLWFTPFSWDPESKVFKEGIDYFIRDTYYQKPAAHWWAGTFLDMSSPYSIILVAETVRRMVREWGFSYLKLDALFSGMGVDHLYPALPYQYDHLNERSFHGREASPVSAYRNGLDVVKRIARDSTYILGCNAPQNMRTLGASIGLVDGMRIGRDVGMKYDRLLQVASAVGIQYFWNNRVWHNDPDCLMLRPPLTLDEARLRATLIGISGQMNLVGEYLPTLKNDRLEIFKRTLPPHPYHARPVDLFSHNPAQIWQVSAEENGIQFNIIAALNWDENNSAEIPLPLQTLLQGDPAGYAAYEFWSGTYFENVNAGFSVKLRPKSAQIFAFKKKQAYPVVLSTSRHITQGLISMQSEKWEQVSSTLSGASSVITGDPYTLYIVVPAGLSLDAASAAGPDGGQVKATHSQSGTLLQVTLSTAKTEDVEWSVQFK